MFREDHGHQQANLPQHGKPASTQGQEADDQQMGTSVHGDSLREDRSEPLCGAGQQVESRPSLLATTLIGHSWWIILIPLFVFISCLMALLWLRKQAFGRLSRLVQEARWPADAILYQPIKHPALVLCIVLSAYLALAASDVPSDWKTLAGRLLWTWFVCTSVLAVLNVVDVLILLFGRRYNPPGGTSILRTITSVVLIGFLAIVVAGIWGAPTGPLLLLIAVGAMLVLLILRDAARNFLAGFQLVVGQDITVGDSVQLEGGEESQIVRLGWCTCQLQTSKGDVLVIPNSQLIGHRVIKSVPHLNETKPHDPSSILTKREIEVARLISRGATNKEVAEKLFITENTAKVHLKNILRKLELKNRQQLAVYFVLREKDGDETGAALTE